MSDADEMDIRELIAGRVSAINASDLDQITASLSSEVVTFDMVGTLRDVGSANAKESLKGWLALYSDGPFWEDQDVTIAAAGDVAFAHMLSHVTGHRKDGVDIDMWFRTTLGLRRIDHAWQIVHEHQSEPFDIESGRASLHLKP